MLNSYELENFKAFGERVRIEFAPITLIFGENSAGKSSILQSLNLLKQTRESREHGSLLLPRAEGGIVDLGSFQELLYDHDTSRTLKFQFEIPTGRRGRRFEAVNGDEDYNYAFEIGVRRTP
ncbi:MAG: AAA family ATPase, partial [Planctomycetales bacterium]